MEEKEWFYKTLPNGIYFAEFQDVLVQPKNSRKMICPAGGITRSEIERFGHRTDDLRFGTRSNKKFRWQAQQASIWRQINRLFTIVMLSIATPCLWAGSAHGGSAAANMGVSARVVKSASVSTLPLVFGLYDSIDENATSDLRGSATIRVGLTKGVSATIGLGTGNHSPGSLTSRAMSDGVNTLSYEIYKDAGFTQIWTDFGAGLLDTGVAPFALPRNFVVRGLVPAGQNAPKGSYTDTIVVTVNF